MSILITGVTGTLGTILAEYFLRKKVLDVRRKSHHRQKKFESFNTNNELFFYNSIDIRKVTEIKKWYKDVKGKQIQLK